MPLLLLLARRVDRRAFARGFLSQQIVLLEVALCHSQRPIEFSLDVPIQLAQHAPEPLHQCREISQSRRHNRGDVRDGARRILLNSTTCWPFLPFPRSHHIVLCILRPR